MQIERTDDEVIIRLPASIDVEGLQRLVDFLSYKEAILNSKAVQAGVGQLADEVKRGWWSENRSRFIN